MTGLLSSPQQITLINIMYSHLSRTSTLMVAIMHRFKTRTKANKALLAFFHGYARFNGFEYLVQLFQTNY
jgi:hypothetical protein